MTPRAPMPLFTAAQIAGALSLSKRSVLLKLRLSPRTGEREVRGQRAQAWSVDALPAEMQQQLATEAQRRRPTAVQVPAPTRRASRARDL